MALPNATSRSAQRREQTRRDLLDAARQVLSSKGYHRTKVADIVRAANVGVGTFYLYYPTKEALFVALVEDVVRLLRAQVDELQRSVTDPVTLARVRNETFFRFANEHRDLFRIVFGHGDEFHDVVRRAQQLFIADVAENLRQGMQTGAFRPGNPELLAHAFTGVALQVVHWWVEHSSMPVEEVSQAVLDFLMHGLGGKAEGGGPGEPGT